MLFADSTGTQWQADLEGIVRVLRMWAQAKANVENTTITRNSGFDELNFNLSQVRANRVGPAQ